jgi:Arc/MetJ family transcription regulator
MEKKKTLFDKYMEDLRKRYKVEIDDKAMEKAVKMLSEGR